MIERGVCMKGPGKILLLLCFLGLNIGAIMVISRFFEVSWAVLAVSMVVVLGIIDLPGMIRNRKVKKAQRKAQEERTKKNQENKELVEKKREEAIKRQRRMTERNMQNRSKH